MSATNGRPETSANLKRGKVWIVNLDPTVGAEIRKTRPVVVVSSDDVGILPIKLVAPLTEWKARLAGNLWHVKEWAVNNLRVWRLGYGIRDAVRILYPVSRIPQRNAQVIKSPFLK